MTTLVDPNLYTRSIFAIGDRVRVVDKLDKREGWIDCLEKHCGQLGTIVTTETTEYPDGPWYEVEIDGGGVVWWWSHDWLVYQGESDESVQS